MKEFFEKRKRLKKNTHKKIDESQNVCNLKNKCLKKYSMYEAIICEGSYANV